MTARVVMFSGGGGSWAAAKRVAEQHGTTDLHLLFCDTRIEDADTYAVIRPVGIARALCGAALRQALEEAA